MRPREREALSQCDVVDLVDKNCGYFVFRILYFVFRNSHTLAAQGRWQSTYQCGDGHRDLGLVPLHQPIEVHQGDDIALFRVAGAVLEVLHEEVDGLDGGYSLAEDHLAEGLVVAALAIQHVIGDEGGVHHSALLVGQLGEDVELWVRQLLLGGQLGVVVYFCLDNGGNTGMVMCEKVNERRWGAGLEQH